MELLATVFTFIIEIRCGGDGGEMSWDFWRDGIVDDGFNVVCHGD